MKRGRAPAIVLLLAAAVLVLLLWRSTRQPPRLPLDADHTRFIDGATCLGCHGLDGSSPREPDHPLGLDCLRCHGLASRGSGAGA